MANNDQLRRKRVYKNTGALYFLQISNYLLPLISLPILIRSLGLHAYGGVAFALSLATLAIVLADLGFSYSGSAEIATLSGQKHAIAQVHSNIFFAKLLISTPLASAIAIVPYAVDRYQHRQLLFLCVGLSVVVSSTIPFWLFQGIQKLGFVTLYALFSRLTYVFLIIAFVGSPADVNRVGFAYLGSALAGAILSHVVAWRIGYGLVKPEKGGPRRATLNSLPYLWGRLASTFAGSGGVILLGIFGAAHQTAVFSLCEQLYRAAQAMASPVVQAIFPHMVVSNDLRLLRRALLATTLIGGLAVVGVLLTADWLLPIAFGSGLQDVATPVSLTLLAFTAYWPSTIIAVAGLGAFGKIRWSNISEGIGSVALIGAFGTVVLSQRATATNVAACLVVFEVIVLWLRIHGFRGELFPGIARSSITFRRGDI